MDDAGTWGLEDLLTWLRSSPGRLALVANDSGGQIISFLGQQLGTTVYAAGREFMLPEPPTSVAEAVERLSYASMLVGNLDLLYWQPWSGRRSSSSLWSNSMPACRRTGSASGPGPRRNPQGPADPALAGDTPPVLGP